MVHYVPESLSNTAGTFEELRDSNGEQGSYGQFPVSHILSRHKKIVLSHSPFCHIYFGVLDAQIGQARITF